MSSEISVSNIRVIIADDHTVVRTGLHMLLDSAEDIEVVGEAENGRETITKVEELQPDIVLMDIAMPEINGFEATKEINKRFANVKVLILTMYEDEHYVSEMLQVGASGYILKKAAATDLISGIRAVYQGDIYLYPSIARKIVEEYLEQVKNGEKRTSYDGLTHRELEILQLIVEGKTNREIAEILFVSITTVRSHRANLMEKLKVHDRSELVRYAIRKGLISP